MHNYNNSPLATILSYFSVSIFSNQESLHFRVDLIYGCVDLFTIKRNVGIIIIVAKDRFPVNLSSYNYTIDNVYYVDWKHFRIPDNCVTHSLQRACAEIEYR